MNHFYVIDESECKKCGNRYRLPVWFSKGTVEGYKQKIITCECGSKSFKKIKHILSKNKIDVPRGKPLMAEGKTKAKGYLFLYSHGKCKKCKKEYLFPATLENEEYGSCGKSARCCKSKYNLLEIKLSKKRLDNPYVEGNRLMVKNTKN